MFQKVWKYAYVVILSLFMFSCGESGSGGGNKPINKPLSAPSNIGVYLHLPNLYNSAIEVRWDRPTDYTSNVYYYYVSYQKSGDTLWSEKKEVIRSTTTVFYNLNEGETYFFRIRAKDNDGTYSPYGHSEGINIPSKN